MLPEGWEKRQLDEVIVLRSGDSRPKDTLPVESEERPYPVYGGNGVMGFSRHKNNEGATIVIGRVGEYCGTTRLIDHPAWITDNALRTIEIAEGFDPAFTELALKKFNLRQLRNKGGQPLVSQKPIYGLALPFPKLSEQGRIVEVISTWDQAIETVDKLIDNARARKKALMQQLLTGKRRLPGFEGEWEEVRLGEIGSTFGGLTGKTKDDFGSGKPFVPYKNVFGNSAVDLSNLTYVRLEPGERQHQVRQGDILFTTSSEVPHEVGMSCVVLEPVSELYLNSFCFGFRPSKLGVLDPNFAQYFLRSVEARRRISRLAQGSTRYNISAREVMKIPFSLPPLEEQVRIADVISAASQQERVLRSDKAALGDERRALMQQLLTGKRRVKVEEAA